MYIKNYNIHVLVMYNLFPPKSLVERKWIPKKKEKKKRCPQHGMTSNVIHKLYEDHATV